MGTAKSLFTICVLMRSTVEGYNPVQYNQYIHFILTI
jgi:hypothetical protein